MNRCIRATASLCLVAGGALWAGIVSAAKLNVPADFPGSFRMDLLGGFLVVDDPGTSSLFNTATLDTAGHQILFDASAFDGVGAGSGTSNLTLTSTDDWHVGSLVWFGFPADLYIRGGGTGTLIDNGSSTAGDWTLDVPLVDIWRSLEFTVEDFYLTTWGRYPTGPPRRAARNRASAGKAWIMKPATPTWSARATSRWAKARCA